MRNSSVTSAANATAVVTIAGITGQQVRLYRVDGYTSAGTSGLTITDGGTTIYQSPATLLSSSAFTAISWTQPLAANPGNTMVITASAAGVGNTVTINVEADDF